ncbi:membrane-associated tyrosine- and threonine-specific cdc2-inhibitory kinase [Folsomia candida]|uniref:membrane-associated tyrosine- and threonine-specific cdc2-inhibitory kinase n=1 Tax=Folsomia candida TaxID=158441 RepID=UPI000B8EF86E|nr:membrane-associated tyrosine- and threonine-specific cdc2-inhibitory kinase [Folsomia candida]
MDDAGESTHYRTRTGVHLPRFLMEPRSLSSKKDREKQNLRYVPPAPRPHYVRSAPTQTRLIHSRFGVDSQDLDNSFQLLMSGGNNATTSIFRSTFDIQERLGFGSFGDVFRVRSKLNQKEYAVKKSRRMYIGEADRARQLREVNRMTDIEPNPHLVELETAWEEDGHLFFQLELCSKSLNQKIEEGGFLTEEEAWDVLVDMLYALQHLHKNLLVHMDVKPENIFLTIDTPTKYKLGDFGIIVCLNENRDLTEFTEGDSRYLAPEVMQGTITTKADVFSLALTILEISCHVDLPKSGSLWHELRNGQLPEPTNNLVPATLEPIIKEMLTPDINERPSINDLLCRSDVQSRIRQRNWMFRRAWVGQKCKLVCRIWAAFMSCLASLFFFTKYLRQGNERKDVPASEVGRRTPEPFPADRDIPNVLLNDSSFSDDEERRPKSPTLVFASTPISHSKTRSGGIRLRNSRLHQLGAVTDNDLRTVVGSPSRNLLKEFEAVSD